MSEHDESLDDWEARINALPGAEPSPLDKMSAEDIFAHLAGRFDALVVAWETRPNHGQSGRNYYYAGGIAAGIGLAAFAQHQLLHNPPPPKDTPYED